MGGVIKYRQTGRISGKSIINYFVEGFAPNLSSLPYDLWGYEETYSQSHPELFYYRDSWKRALKIYQQHGDPEVLRAVNILRYWDVGGPFYNRKTYVDLQSSRMVGGGGLGLYKTYFIDTPFFVVESNTTRNSGFWPLVTSMSNEQDALLAKGSIAISRTAPTVPVTSLANFVGELKNDGLPSLIGSVLHRVRSFPQLLKAVGNEYLNVEFGWKPLLRDILEISKAVQRSGRIIEQYERDSGRNIARSYEFPPIRSTSISDYAQLYPQPSVDFNAYVGPARRMVTKSVEDYRHYWFEGVYSYNLPVPSEARGKVLLYASEAEKLLGLRVTPEVLWNLAPWSWFVDWFFNIGSIMTNASAFSKDDLMLRRGYMMCTSYTKHTYTHPGFTLVGVGNTGVLSQSYVVETKARVKASPWGFGLTFTAFTPKQIAIMAALGLTRDWQVRTWK